MTKQTIEAKILKIKKVMGQIQAGNYSNGFSYFDSRMKILQTENDTDLDAYSAVMEPEKLIIRIDDSGVVYFKWKNPTSSDGIISENVQLLDFEKIKEIFSNHKFYHQFYDGAEGSLNIYINKIVLSYFIQLVIDNNDEYIVIQVGISL